MASLQGHVSSFIEWDQLTGENVSQNPNMIFHGKLLQDIFRNVFCFCRHSDMNINCEEMTEIVKKCFYCKPGQSEWGK